MSAPASLVWRVLVDGSRYPEWNPFILQVIGDLNEGATVRYRFQFLRGLKIWATAEVLRAEPEVELRWSAHFLTRAIFNGEHYFTITPTSASSVIFHHGEVFSGLLSAVAWPLLRRRGHEVYIRLNRALKARVEPSRPADPTVKASS
jgi:hypothetical protein